MNNLEKITNDESTKLEYKHNNLVRCIYNFGSQYIDYKFGSIGAGIMGGIVWYINSNHGFLPATTASLKQATYTFLFGGFVMKTCENLSTKIKNKNLAKILSIVIPSVITIGLMYLVHNLKGTPEPLESTIPTMILSPPSFMYWSHRKRSQLKNNNQNKY